MEILEDCQNNLTRQFERGTLIQWCWWCLFYLLYSATSCKQAYLGLGQI